MADVFTYGSLLMPEVWHCVVGERHDGEPARLRGYRRHALHGAPYPAVIAASGAEVEGTCWHDIDAPALERLDAFEGDLYDRVSVPVVAASGTAPAWVYVLAPAHHALAAPHDWDLAGFRSDALAEYLEGCRAFAAAWDRGLR